ncbi:hypothetical protein JW865_08700 [Candidatus Bathyarchaeota archaeon]|nr:hypothetical protein [Candidatus Bathyarchaeota archaeon]
MTIIHKKHRGITSLVIIVFMLVFLSSASAVYLFTDVFKPKNEEMTGSSLDSIKVLNDAFNDLEKSGCTIVEVESMPSGSIELLNSYSDFKNSLKTQTVYCFAESNRCSIFFEKDNKIFVWSPQKWEKIKLIKESCDLQTPGWLITLEIKNSGNGPIQISKIYVAGDEIAGINFNTDNYVPLSTSCTIKNNVSLEPNEKIILEIRVSNYYKYLKIGSVCEIKIYTISGYSIKRIINFVSNNNN